MSLAFVLALFFQAQPAAADAAQTPATPAPAAADAPPASESAWPTGAPHDDYQLVAWCYGALRGYLDLHDDLMPEVTRIESEFRRPGSKLSDDLKVYSEQQRQARADLKRFQAAMTAAEKASVRPINTIGAAAVIKGRSVWNAGPEITKARMAQEWMSWTLPARCQSTADELQKRATLMGATFKVNTEDEAAPAPTEPAPSAEKPADPPAAAPVAESPK
jgi:hypothetical protein